MGPLPPGNEVNRRWWSSLEPGSEAPPASITGGLARIVEVSSAGIGELARSLELDRRLAAAKGKAGEAREWIEGALHEVARNFKVVSVEEITELYEGRGCEKLEAGSRLARKPFTHSPEEPAMSEKREEKPKQEEKPKEEEKKEKKRKLSFRCR